MRRYVVCLFCILLLCLSGSGSVNSATRPDFEISGRVKDVEGEPLAGVNVYNAASKTGVMTDAEGVYRLKVSDSNSSLTFSFIGMKTVTVKISGRNVIDLVLENDSQMLSDAVIVGAYGTKQSREDLVGSAFQVNSNALKDKPTARLNTILEGLVPGMTIESNADYAGSTRDRINVRIRGEASLNASNEPLWIIDGVKAYTGGRTGMMPGVSYTVSPLTYLDPNDIESITVLKDADQTTIYGANGANGVILVTTKRGAAGNQPLNVTAQVNYGVSSPDKSTMFKMMNASQYMEVAKEAWTNAGYSISDFPYQDNDYNKYSTTSTDWVDQYLGLGSTLYANVSASTGNKRNKNRISGSYYKKKNTVQQDESEQFYLRMTSDYNITDRLKFGVSLSGTFTTDDMFNLGKDYLSTLPIFEPYLEDGYSYRLYNKIWDESRKGFVMKRFYDNEIPERNEDDLVQKSVQTVANFDLNWEIFKGLSFSTLYGVTYQHTHEDDYHSRLTLYGLDNNGNPVGVSSKNDASIMNWQNTNKLNFNRKFGKHSVSSYAGLELTENYSKTLNAYGSGFLNDHIREIAYATEDTRKGSSTYNISRSMSYFLRGQYSYGSRYYVSFNARREGNSSFSKYSRWSDYWSVGASWNIHNEKFFHSNMIKMLKLKTSYGTAGNSRVDSSSGKGTYTYGNSYSYMGEMGAALGTIPNNNLTWETTTKLNLGARIELKNILDAEFEYYHEKTNDLLTKIYVSRTVSDDRIYANVGSMLNQGWELNFTTYNFNRRDFQWTTSMNMSHNKNKILKLYEGIPTGFFTSVWMEGYDSNTWYLVRWAGVDPADGMPMWYDKNGNVTKTYSSENRVPDKSRTPLLFGGMVNTLTYKNLSLSFQINYTIGGYVLPTYASNFMGDGYNITGGNQAVEVYYYRWRNPGETSKFPKVSQTTTRSGMSSTRFLYNKTNFKLTNVILSYKLPKKVLDRMKLNDASVSMICDNAYIFTPDQSSRFNSYKTAMNGYPVTRTVSLGLNLSF